MRGLVKLRWYQFGNLILYQVSGIPIGGPVSGAVLEAVLGVDEDMFEQIGWVEFSRSIGISGPRELWLTIVRYVDDVFVATRWFCPRCVSHIIKLIYSKTVNFDEACEGLADINGFRVVKFLDLWCYMSWQQCFYALVKTKRPFSLFQPGQPKI